MKKISSLLIRSIQNSTNRPSTYQPKINLKNRPSIHNTPPKFCDLRKPFQQTDFDMLMYWAQQQPPIETKILHQEFKNYTEELKFLYTQQQSEEEKNQTSNPITQAAKSQHKSNDYDDYDLDACDNKI